MGLRVSYLLPVIICLLAMTKPTFTQENEELAEFGPESWQLYLKFLIAFNEQWPIRRLVFVYGMPVFSDPKREDNLRRSARFESALAYIRKRMSLSFSTKGVSLSSVTLPKKKLSEAVSVLRLDDPVPQPPITAVLFSPGKYHASFIREVAEAGGFIGNRVTWIALSSNLTLNEQVLTSDLGLRPDSSVLSVALNTNGASVKRWVGSKLEMIPLEWTVGKLLPYQVGIGGALDLEGQQLSVAVFNDPPFTYVDKNNTFRGWFVDIWKDLQLKLKFNMTMYNPGRAANTGFYRSAAEELKQGRADIVLGPFVQTEQDLQYSDFSSPVTTIRYRFYLQRSTTTSSASQFIKPFSAPMWLCIAATVVVSATLLASTYLTGRHFGFEKQEGAPFFNFKESFLVIYGTVFQQTTEYSPKGLGSRIILWSLYLFGVIVTTTYSSALISKLTIRTVEPPFRSLESMMATHYIPILTTDSAPHRLTLSAATGEWRDLLDRRPRYLLQSSLAQAIEMAAYSSTMTLLAARERVGPLVQKAPLNCQLAQLPADILAEGGRLLLQKDSPYKKAINQQLLQMAGRGRLSRYRERWMTLVKDDACPADASLPRYGLKQVTLPFYVVFGGIGVAAFIVLLEIAWARWFDTGDEFESRAVAVKRAREKRHLSKLSLNSSSASLPHPSTSSSLQ